MERKWTEEQKEVIETRDADLLVSAAAGSGKTAVLVERVISTDHEHPADIDRMLVLTFTDAAASEMKEKIAQALRNMLAADPDNAHLRRQSVFLERARISTIHSFCSYVIRNYFHTIDVDPVYRTADDSERALMIRDVLKELFEKKITERDPEFLEFSKSYFIEKNAASKMADMIEKVYSFADAAPWPKVWLQKAAAQWEEGAGLGNSTKEGDTAKPDEKRGVKAPAEVCLDGKQSDERNAELQKEERVFQEPEFIRRKMESARETVADFLSETEELIRISSGSGGPASYLDALNSDIKMYGRILEQRTFDGMKQAFDAGVYQNLSNTRLKGTDPAIRKRVKARRDAIKNRFQNSRQTFFSSGTEAIRREMAYCAPFVRTLCSLTAEFMDLYAAHKRKKGIMDFSDLEHFALNILVKRHEDGTLERTEAADELASSFVTVMTDEYQDSNEVQELILQSVSGGGNGRHNRFMVGDIKQAIYGFRHARPEIFIEKYHSFGQAESGSKRIDLHKNFRSRPAVIDAVNYIFRRIMSEEIGGVTYDDTAALNAGRIPACDTAEQNVERESAAVLIAGGEPAGAAERRACAAERNAGEESSARVLNISREESAGGLAVQNADGIQNPGMNPAAAGKDAGGAPSAAVLDTCDVVICDRKDPDLADERTANKNTEIEAAMTAAHIKRLMKTMRIEDRATHEYRAPRYGDFVILLRSMAGAAETYTRVLLSEGIPVYAAQRTGYFKTVEVMTVLNYLRILDNPRQDIPLAAVLFSPIGSLTANDLALIRADSSEGGFYDACMKYLKDGGNIAVREKLKAFFDVAGKLRGMIPYTPVHTLIREVFDRTGYRSYAAAMPAGEQRAANLDMLVNRAYDYEKTSYHGLFSFIHYIEQMEKSKIDYGEVSLFTEGTDAVAITTIHKSKGLEYPIVFVCGCGRQFKITSFNDPVILHYDLGIGLDAVDVSHHKQKKTFYKSVVREACVRDMYSEEMRLLYVAMTRAREKLVLVGTCPDLTATIGGCAERKGTGGKVQNGVILSGRSYLDWILSALADDRCFLPAYQWAGIPETSVHDDCGRFRLFIESAAGLTLRRVRELASSENAEQALLRVMKEYHGGGGIDALLDEIGRYQYPYEDAVALPAKYTVSEIKRLAAASGEENDGADLAQEIPIVPYVPGFISKEDTTMTAAARGTIFHKALRFLNLKELFSVPVGENAVSRSEKTDALRNGKDHVFRNGRNETPVSGTAGHGRIGASANDGAGQNRKAPPAVDGGERDVMTEGDRESRQSALRSAAVEQIRSLRERGILSAEEAETIPVRKLAAFLGSNLCRRMAEADARGSLSREKEFTMSVPAYVVDPRTLSGEHVLVQGVIDAFFREGDGYVLVDYKTDHVRTPSELAERYAAQLRCYKYAIELATHKKVRERILYSTFLGQEITLRDVEGAEP